MNTILIIEDDPTLNEGIAMTLNGPETETLSAGSVKEAKAILAEKQPDLILLDVNLPDGDGFSLCREIREKRDTPIVFLTANDMELDVVRGLEMGGDDYITKPFSLMVLRARVNSVLRRRGGQAGNADAAAKNDIYRCGDLELDFEHLSFLRASEPVLLSRTEQKLLKLLVVNRGQVLSKEQLLTRVWETEFVDDHALTVTIKRLRDKLGTRQIKSIYGIGYRWEKEDE